MTFERTMLLGTIAGLTIFLGLPLGRVSTLSERSRGFLSVFAAGILLFIFWDVMSASQGFVESSLEAAKGGAGWSDFALRGAVLVAGLAIGSVGLAHVEHRLLRRRPLPPVAGAAVDVAADAGIDVGDIEARMRQVALRFGMLIAVAIGLHNFSEGLAIGVSAHSGEVGLAGTLIVGFALHNATEGFGIVGPLGGVRPSWRWLAVAGIVGGGPVFLGTLIGFHTSSATLELLFFALAGGAILYVVGQIWTSIGRKLPSRLILWGIMLGYLAGFASDLVISYGGG